MGKEVIFYIMRKGRDYMRYYICDDVYMNNLIKKLGYSSFEYGDNVFYRTTKEKYEEFEKDIKNTDYYTVEIITKERLEEFEKYFIELKKNGEKMKIN